MFPNPATKVWSKRSGLSARGGACSRRGHLPAGEGGGDVTRPAERDPVDDSARKRRVERRTGTQLPRDRLDFGQLGHKRIIPSGWNGPTGDLHSLIANRQSLIPSARE